jgi:hypothetical protein
LEERGWGELQRRRRRRRRRRDQQEKEEEEEEQQQEEEDEEEISYGVLAVTLDESNFHQAMYLSQS